MSTAVLVADGLTGQGFDVRDPALENSQHLKITNARHAYSEITISQNGIVSWEYRSFSGGISPGQITGMVVSVLGADGADCPDASLAQYRGRLTLKGAVGRALRECGLEVCLAVLSPDDDFFELYAEIEVSNPAKRGRGTVRIDDQGMVRWECRLRNPVADSQGIAPGEIADTIAAALTRAEQLR